MMTAQSLLPGYSLDKLLEGFSHSGNANGINITGLTTDSRKVTSGDLFFAFVTGGVSNVSYINAAISAGAKAILVEDNELPDPYLCPVSLFRIKNLHEKIGIIASRFYQHPSSDLTIVGVTGTNGKTSVSHLLTQCLDMLSGHNCGLIGTLGYGPLDKLVPGLNTTPEPVTLQALLADMRDRKFRHVVMEVSSHGLDQYRTAGVEFDLAVFTNLSRDHLDYHKSMENYAFAKQRLFTDYNIRKQVINVDDDFGSRLYEETFSSIEKVATTLDVKKLKTTNKYPNLVYGEVVSTQAGGMKIFVDTPWGKSQLLTSFVGKYNVHNLLSVLSSLCLLGHNFDDAMSVLSRCKNIPGRMEFIGNSTTPRVVVDYAHTPDALEHVLSTLKPVCTGNLHCVFGCGGDRDSGKRPLMAAVAERYSNIITITSDNPRNEDPGKIIQEIYSGITDKKKVNIEIDRKTAIHNAIGKAKVNDIILIAGKGHESYQEITGTRYPFSDQKIAAQFLEKLHD